MLTQFERHTSLFYVQECKNHRKIKNIFHTSHQPNKSSKPYTMKQLIICLAIVFTMTTPALAQNQSKKDKIKALFAEMHQDSLIIKTFETITSSAVGQMTALFKDSAFTHNRIDPSKIAEKLLAKNMQRSKEIALRMLNEDFVDIYDKYFSEKEIDDFRNFYQSPSGQKLLNKTPDITKDVMSIMTTKYQSGLQQSLIKDIEEFRKESSQ